MKLKDLQENLRDVPPLNYWYFREGEEQIEGRYKWTSQPIEKAKVEMELHSNYSEFGTYGPQVWMTGEGMEILVGASSYEEATAKVRQYLKIEV